MKRKFTASPSMAVTSATQTGYNIHSVKALTVAQAMWRGEYDEISDGRIEDLDWSMYLTVEELADDIPMILWVAYGLEGGEDYQLLNQTSILPVDSSNPIWPRVAEALCWTQNN